MLPVFTNLAAGLLVGEAIAAPTLTTFFRNETRTSTATPSLELNGEPPADTCTSIFMYDYQALEQAVVELCRSGSPTHRLYFNPYGYTPEPEGTMNTCWSSWDTESAEYFATAPITTGTYGTQPSAVYYQQPWNFVASPPCCSSCTLFGGTVQVYFWPTPAPSPPVSILTNTDNFTFISPSIYVAFESLYANNLCGDVGKVIPRTTIAFEETALSTSLAFQWNTDGYYPFTVKTPDAFTRAHFGDQSDCIDITSTWYNGPISGIVNTIPLLTRGTKIPFTYNLCSPAVSVPSELFSLNPLWTACAQGVSAFFDPPYSLTPGNGLQPLPTPAVNSPVEASPKTGDPAPGAVPDPGSAKPTDKPSVPNDTPSQPPAGNDTSAQDPPTNDPPMQQPPSTKDPSPPAPPLHNTAQPPSNDHPVLLVVTLGTSIITANSASVFIVDAQTMSPGGSLITIAGTRYSIAVNGAVFNSAPDLLNPSSFASITTTTTVQLVLGSATLIAGGSSVMVDGTILGLDSSGSSIVIGGSTVAVSEFLGTQTQISTSLAGIGAIIASIGGFETPVPTTSPFAISNSTKTSKTVSMNSTSVQTMNQPTNSVLGHSIATVTGTAPTESIKCGMGLLVCQVEDPTRLELPWHGVSAAFPQCYNPTTYQCVENFLCPIDAPKIKGKYACGSGVI